MDLLGGISGGEWGSLDGIYSSQDDQADNYDFQLIMFADDDNNLPDHIDCAVTNYNLNIMGASSLEAHPVFTNIWPGCTDSTIIHDMAAATFYSQDHVPKFYSSQIVNYQPADTLVTNNVAFCEDRKAELLLTIEGDDNDHPWLNINQEMSCNREESGQSLTTAAHVVPPLKWEQPDKMMITVPNQPSVEDGSLSSGNSKKRSRRTADDQDARSYKRNVVKSRENKKVVLSENEEETSAGSGEISDASHEELGGMIASSPIPSPKGGAPALNRNGKARATRGSATDSQSVYARKRREKINERLRILQNLVPNGTKVDISTMLEEAAQYVKFLQLQINLLSSDDLWMYAPLAYNGMDIGLQHLSLAASKQ